MAAAKIEEGARAKMDTKAEIDARLAQIPLLTMVDVEPDGRPRRMFRYRNPSGRGDAEFEYDALPTDQQLQDLARHIPVLEQDRAAALAIFREP